VPRLNPEPHEKRCAVDYPSREARSRDADCSHESEHDPDGCGVTREVSEDEHHSCVGSMSSRHASSPCTVRSPCTAIASITYSRMTTTLRRLTGMRHARGFEVPERPQRSARYSAASRNVNGTDKDAAALRAS
jgi:hypothetical protein